MRNRKKYAYQDELTGEWFFNGQWYDSHPSEEQREYNDRYDEWMESKLDEKRDEGAI